jgi:CDP-glucose 4,6-dehydratase
MAHFFTDFYRGKRVLVTGHTGFEGGWTAAWLKHMGAQVCGYGLPPATRPNFFDATILDRGMTSVFGDIRDRNSLANTFTEMQPEIVIHCAAQTSPESSLRDPVGAFSTNVMGTVHILEEARLTKSVRAVVLVSGDSCSEQAVHSSADDKSKSNGMKDLLCATMASAQLVRAAFEESFFQNGGTAVATARTADAIGGGEWREGRIIADLVRGIVSGKPLALSREQELRIWHVLEPIRAWLLLGRNLFESGKKSGGVWDFAPKDQHRILASELAEKFSAIWKGADTSQTSSSKPPVCRSNPEKSQAELGRTPVLCPDQVLAWTVEWYRDYCSDPASTLKTTQEQIEKYMQLCA